MASRTSISMLEFPHQCQQWEHVLWAFLAHIDLMEMNIKRTNWILCLCVPHHVNQSVVVHSVQLDVRVQGRGQSKVGHSGIMGHFSGSFHDLAITGCQLRFKRIENTKVSQPVPLKWTSGLSGPSPSGECFARRGRCSSPGWTPRPRGFCRCPVKAWRQHPGSGHSPSNSK